MGKDKTRNCVVFRGAYVYGKTADYRIGIGERNIQREREREGGYVIVMCRVGKGSEVKGNPYLSQQL